MTPMDDPRAELASVAASLRAYLEQQQESGATGIPRGKAMRSEGGARKMAPTAAPAPVKATPESPNPTPILTKAPSLSTLASSPQTSPPTPAPAIASASASAGAPDPHVPDPRHSRLPVLAQEVASCTRCALSAARTQTVFARGNPDATICFVGEAPGAEEDAQGLPFVGRAGQLLDRMVMAMGLSPEKDVYICNIIKCRPPGNRRPEPEETAACIPYLHEQLALVKPRVIVALGNTAVGTLLNTKLGITKLRGQWKLYRGATLVMPTYHPSYLLRPSPQQADAKRQAWEDLQAVLRELKLPIPKPRKNDGAPPPGSPKTGDSG
jgi:uracil-DNA glycosylase family 4